MAKRIKLPKSQKKHLLKLYAEQLDSMSLLDVAAKSFQDNFTYKSTVKPVIKFTKKAMLIIQELVQQCEKEIAWNGLVEYDAETNTYTVYDILIFPQIVTGTSVNVDETKYAMWLAGLTNEQLRDMRFHGHSHVNMGVSPSGIDTGYQKEMLDMQIKDFYIFMIFNKRHDMYACIYDVEQNAFYEKDDIIIEEESKLNPYKDLVSGWINDYVSQPKPAYGQYPTYGTQPRGVVQPAQTATGYWVRELARQSAETRQANTLREFTD